MPLDKHEQESETSPQARQSCGTGREAEGLRAVKAHQETHHCAVSMIEPR
jgi:hypothetical protein